ncbi:MAG: hypothetical protein DMD35_19595 [Gemmatimonadetes bacterium]|nr:MAG: hypothetical protein DMD35_19595 [Gemmatimonadota bacterium]
MRFQLDDTVRIVRLLVPERDVTGTSEHPPQPRVGDIGTIAADIGDDLYLVESNTDDGATLWMAECNAAEIELVERASQED